MGVESGLWLLWLLPDWAGEVGRCFPESTLDAEDGFSRDHHLWTSFDHQIQAISKCYLSRSTYQEDETESLSIYAVCIPGTYGYIVYSDTAGTVASWALCSDQNFTARCAVAESLENHPSIHGICQRCPVM